MPRIYQKFGILLFVILSLQNCTFYKAFSYYKFEQRAAELSNVLIVIAKSEKKLENLQRIKQAIRLFETKTKVVIEQYYVFDGKQNLIFNRVLSPYGKINIKGKALAAEQQSYVKSKKFSANHYNFLPAYVDIFIKTAMPLNGHLLVRLYQDEIKDYKPSKKRKEGFIDFYYGKFKKLELKERLKKELDAKRRQLKI